MTAKKRRSKILKFLVLGASFVFASQACTKNFQFKSTSQIFKNQESGNGGSYGGKPGTYVNFEAARPCDIAADGSPLPNNQINVFAVGKADLVRSNCKDIAPTSLTASEFQIFADEFKYQGEQFAYRAPQSDFRTVAAHCPASYNAIVGATRTNLLTSSQNLIEPGWTVMPGVTSILEGTLAGLNAFTISRTNLQSWQRVRQDVNLNAGKLYSLSVLARQGTDNGVRFEFEQPTGGQIGAVLDTSSGSIVISGNNGFSQVSVASYQISDAHFFTIYFSPDVNMSGNIGLSTNQVGIGESISATAVQLEEVASFCTP